MTAEQLNVLVIDDEPEMRDLLAQIIARTEHQPVLASSAEEALELLPFWTFQVAFIDQRLPGMEGLVFGEYLRENNPDMTIALVTGQDDRKLQRRSRDLSMAYITKPFRAAQILEVIDTHLRGAQSRIERHQRQLDGEFDPPIGHYLDEVRACFAMPSPPSRIENRLVAVLKERLNDLRQQARYTERDRVVVLCGLIAAVVLDIDLPRMPSGRTPFEEYDELMRQSKRRREFDPP